MMSPPSQINDLRGFRTKRSMKNQDMWIYAHKYVGKLWKISSPWIALLSVIGMCFSIGKDVMCIGFFGGAIVGVQIIVFIIEGIRTEYALKNNFTEEGKLKAVL